jgi:hypothetical protein
MFRLTHKHPYLYKKLDCKLPVVHGTPPAGHRSSEMGSQTGSSQPPAPGARNSGAGCSLQERPVVGSPPTRNSCQAARQRQEQEAVLLSCCHQKRSDLRRSWEVGTADAGWPGGVLGGPSLGCARAHLNPHVGPLMLSSSGVTAGRRCPIGSTTLMPKPSISRSLTL